jgi:hypothetical protein
MRDESWIRRNAKENVHSRIYYPGISLEGQRKITEISGRIVSGPSENQTEHTRNKSIQLYRYNKQFGEPGFDYSEGQKIFLICRESRPTLGGTPNLLHLTGPLDSALLPTTGGYIDECGSWRITQGQCPEQLSLPRCYDSSVISREVFFSCSEINYFDWGTQMYVPVAVGGRNPGFRGTTSALKQHK